MVISVKFLGHFGVCILVMSLLFSFLCLCGTRTAAHVLDCHLTLSQLCHITHALHEPSVSGLNPGCSP
eukprot:c31598_g1_i1 orf=42-245(+)